MTQSLTHDELRAHQHSLLPNPLDYRVIRYEVDVDPASQATTRIVITLQSEAGEIKRLSFHGTSIPQFSEFQIPCGLFNGSVYVVDTGFRGWEDRARIEVGSLSEDKPTFFYAEGVEDAT
ncbi:MAG: hypothetical protein ACI9VS_001123 [Candidatus Binatia bacterium]|jgi:hypothetical protein